MGGFCLETEHIIGHPCHTYGSYAKVFLDARFIKYICGLIQTVVP